MAQEQKGTLSMSIFFDYSKPIVPFSPDIAESEGSYKKYFYTESPQSW